MVVVKHINVFNVVKPKLAKNKPTPDDWIYLYNFNNSNEPNAVSLPAGIGKQFAEDMDSFMTLRILKDTIPENKRRIIPEDTSLRETLR